LSSSPAPSYAPSPTANAEPWATYHPKAPSPAPTAPSPTKASPAAAPPSSPTPPHGTTPCGSSPPYPACSPWPSPPASYPTPPPPAPRTVAGLAARVSDLATNRDNSGDTPPSDSPRIERVLHDGAGARLAALRVLVGMAEPILPRAPPTARTMLSEARETP